MLQSTIGTNPMLLLLGEMICYSNIKKKKKTIESPYQLTTITSTLYIVLAFVNITMYNIMNINSR